MLDILAWIFKGALYSPADEHSGPSQASQMELFEKTVNVFKLMLQFFSKTSKDICKAW